MALFPDPDSPALAKNKSPLALTLHFDGGSRGNPGPAGIGLVLYDHDHTPLYELGEFLGHRTSNFAEYTALLRGLAAAKTFGESSLKILSDSELVVRQLNGQYKVKSPDLLPLYQQARKLITDLGHVTVTHVYREKNKRADELANLAMDQMTKLEPLGPPWTPGSAKPKPKSAAPTKIDSPAEPPPPPLTRSKDLAKLLALLEPIRTADAKLTIEELEILLRIAQRPGQTPGEIGDKMKKSPTAILKLLKPDLIYTDNRESDSSEDALYLTEKADRLIAQLLAVLTE